MKTLTEALADPLERMHVIKVLAEPTSRAARTSYLSVLSRLRDSRDLCPRRARALELNLQLTQSLSPQQAQPLIDELLAIIDQICPEWWSAVRLGDPLFNCHHGTQDTPRIRFMYRCPMRWDWLSETADVNVRRCGQCGESVVRCDTVEQAQEHAKMGDCISLPTQVYQPHAQGLTEMMTGRPDPVEVWAQQIFED